jgi:hypothetical protein
MGDIVIGDKNVLGNNSRIIKIDMKNYFGSDFNKDEGVPGSNIVETEEAEYEEVKDSQQKETDKDIKGGEEKLNYTSPTIALKRMLEGDWFDKVSTNKGLYIKEWRTKLVADLMTSEHGTYIARLWEHKDKRATIKGQLIGTLVEAGVLNKNKSAVARAYLGISDNTRDVDEKKEANTFGKYIGQGDKEPYADWVKDYVEKTPQKKN